MRGTTASSTLPAVEVVVGILGEMDRVSRGAEVADSLVEDYVSPWLSGREDGFDASKRLVTADLRLGYSVFEDNLHDLLTSSARLTDPKRKVVYHGDLHSRNLVISTLGRVSVIDWDDAAFSNRPGDAAKALWLLCRQARGDFVLDPSAVRVFLHAIKESLHIPYTRAQDLARLGAVWFLPSLDHLTLLEQRDPAMVAWYLSWTSRFWIRFRSNLRVIAQIAEQL